MKEIHVVGFFGHSTIFFCIQKGARGVNEENMENI